VSWLLTPRFSYLSPFVLFRICSLVGGFAVVDLLDLSGPPAPEPKPRYCASCLAPVVGEDAGGSRPHYTPQAANEVPAVCTEVAVLRADVAPAALHGQVGTAGFVRCRCGGLWTWTHPERVRTSTLVCDRCPSCRSGL